VPTPSLTTRPVAAALAAVLSAAALAACRGATPGPATADPSAGPPDPAALLAEGDAAWASRGDPARREAALAAFRRAAALQPGAPGAELRLARAEALRAQLAAAEPEERDGWDAASRAAERALRTLAPAFAAAIARGEDPVNAASAVDTDGAEPLYWLAVGRLRVAQATGPMAVLAAKDVVIGLLARAAALDETVDRAGPHRWLGALAAALPAAAGGGVAMAREHFERARALAPGDPFLPVQEASTLAVLLQDGARFDALVAEVRGRDPAKEPALAAELTAARRQADRLAARRARWFD
jgi:hypothetical protein